MRATDDAAKAKMDAEVTALNDQIAEQEEAQAEAAKKASRLEEEKTNADYAAKLAESIRSSRENTQAVLADLAADANKVRKRVKDRRGILKKQQEAADSLRFAAEGEADEGKQAIKWKSFEKAQAIVDQGHQAMADDEVLAKEYERNMTNVRNTARIDAAKMFAEKANAELMVAVKADANMATDLTELVTKKTALTTKMAAESDATKKSLLTARIADIN
jgi:hypothetical protein